MDLVLGLAITSTAVRWVLAEETTGEGTTVDRGSFDIATAEKDSVADAVLDHALSAAGDNRIYAVGVTWTDQAEDAASDVLQALAARALENVIAVSEFEAADVLAAGIAEIAAYDNAAVCIVEPDSAVIATVTTEGVTVDRIDRPLDGADAVELPSSVIAMLDLEEWRPDAIFVIGSADDLDLIVSTLDSATESPVISAAESDLALARGAALASARAVETLEAAAAPARPRLMSRMGVLTSALVAAVLTLVVSLSVALGLGLTPETEQPQVANAVDEPARGAIPPSVAQAAPPSVAQATPQQSRPPAPPPLPAAAAVAKTLVVAAPPAPAGAPAAGPVYNPPAAAPPAPAYVPPAPAYVPPAPAPNYVPPVAPEPRLRDRIIERIPIINRFHEPDYPYPR